MLSVTTSPAPNQTLAFFAAGAVAQAECMWHPARQSENAYSASAKIARRMRPEGWPNPLEPSRSRTGAKSLSR